MLTWKPIRVAVLCSHRAPGLLDLVERFTDRRSYEIVGVVTSELAFEGQAHVAALRREARQQRDRLGFLERLGEEVLPQHDRIEAEVSRHPHLLKMLLEPLVGVFTRRVLLGDE